jgi:prolyl-tRNA editing enzyme YbaK/EbsC (Cys-tRNA(Pro) deacylase)
VASKRSEKKFAACLVRASDRLDVNKRVRTLMGVSRLSFASAEETRELTGMEIGGVTPFALSEDLRIYVDTKVMELEYVILGSGSRSSKIKVSPSVLRKLTNVEIVEGLSLE